MKHRLVCMVLAVLMVLAMATACNSTPTPATTAAPQTATAAPSGQTPTAAPAAQTATAAPAAQELYEFTLYGNIATELKEPDVALFEDLGERLNLKINVQIPPSSNYNEALTIMMAGGVYPELVLFPNHTTQSYIDGVRDGVILPLNEYLDNCPNLMEYSYPVSWKTLRTNGDDNIYAVPRTSIARADGYMLRSDWLAKGGFEWDETKPVTLEQFEAMLTYITNEDPDGNGANDTYGLGVSSGDGNLGLQFGWAFDLIGWQEYADEPYKYMDIKYSKTKDNYKRALEFNNKLWEAKALDPDWPTVNTDAMNNRINQGILGGRGEFAGWMIQSEQKIKENFPDAELKYIVGLVQNEGDPVVGGSYSTGFWGQWALMNSAKQPERIMEMLDYMLSDDYWDTMKYGLEGMTWNPDASGAKIATDKYKDYAAGRAILRRDDDPGFFITLDMSPENRDRLETLIGVCIEQAIFSKDEGFRPAVADDPAYIDANKELNTVISKIIAGDMPVSDWDAALDKWYKAGGETYIQQMNDGIIANQ